jgi:hypothetical protein
MLWGLPPALLVMDRFVVISTVPPRGVSSEGAGRGRDDAAGSRGRHVGAIVRIGELRLAAESELTVNGVAPLLVMVTVLGGEVVPMD